MKYLDLNYQLDSAELGKIITIFSLATLLFSIHGYYAMQDVETQIKDSQNQLEDGLRFIESDDSQRIIEAAQDIRGLSEEFLALEQGFQSAETSLNSTREAATSVEQTKKSYQWMVVLSISSIIAGITIILIDV